MFEDLTKKFTEAFYSIFENEEDRLRRNVRENCFDIIDITIDYCYDNPSNLNYDSLIGLIRLALNNYDNIKDNNTDSYSSYFMDKLDLMNQNLLSNVDREIIRFREWKPQKKYEYQVDFLFDELCKGGEFGDVFFLYVFRFIDLEQSEFEFLSGVCLGSFLDKQTKKGFIDNYTPNEYNLLRIATRLGSREKLLMSRSEFENKMGSRRKLIKLVDF